MTPEQKQQRISEIEQRQLYSDRRDRDVDFLLSLVKSQEAGAALAEQIVDSSFCAEPSGNCEESAAVHVRDLIRSIAAIPAPQYDALCGRHRDEFTTYHVGGCLECWKRSEQESAATSMRSACVEKVLQLARARAEQSKPESEDHEYDLAAAYVLYQAAEALESVSIQEQEKDAQA